MIDFKRGEEFLVAVQRPYKLDEVIEAQGLRGRITEPISHEDYITVWAFCGFNSEAVSVGARFYYRCKRLFDKPPLPSPPGSETEVRGEQESGL